MRIPLLQSGYSSSGGDCLPHNYFNGLYFRHQAGGRTVAVIPSIHTDSHGTRSAFVQVITDTKTYSAQYPADAIEADPVRARLRIGHNFFSPEGIRLEIQNGDLSVQGQLSYRELTPPRYDIMGPFAYAPFLECRHSVISYRHLVDGRLTLNGEELIFKRGIGYIEGDRGRSFPRRYLWTQCSFGENGSLMLSAGEIPYLGCRFNGVIAAVVQNGRERRIATYLGARIEPPIRGSITVRQGRFSLTAQLLERREQELYAPVSGSMSRMIRESAACRARYQLKSDHEVLLEFASDQAGFELEW